MPRPSRPWFRFYVEAVHDRKLRRLKPEYRWLFVACLAAARQSPTPGVLLVGVDDPMTLEDLADFAGMSHAATRAGLAALVAAGVLDDGDAYSVPAWAERQFESDDVTARTAKHRSKEQGWNVSSSPDGTPPETETEADTELATSATSTKDPFVAEARRRCETAKAADVPIHDEAQWVATVATSLRSEGWQPPKPDPYPSVEATVARIHEPGPRLPTPVPPAVRAALRGGAS